MQDFIVEYITFKKNWLFILEIVVLGWFLMKYGHKTLGLN